MTTNTMKVLVLKGMKWVVEDAKVLPNDGRCDINFEADGVKRGANWRLLFIDEALSLCLPSVFDTVCYMAGMPGEYDWSFIRDADEETQIAIAEVLFKKTGKRMKSLGLESVKFYEAGC